MFYRILNRPPVDQELAAGIAALRTFDDDHAKLAAELAAYEKTLPAKQAEWEKSGRGAGLDAARDRHREIGGGRDVRAMRPIARSSPAASWPRTNTRWSPRPIWPASPASAWRRSTDPRLPQGGPGRAPQWQSSAQRAAAHGRADERSGKGPAGRAAKCPGRLQSARLGRLRRDRRRSGHRLGAAPERRARTTWPCSSAKNDVGAAGGSLLFFTLDQQFGDGHHELGKFRLSVTTSKRPIRLAALPENIAKLLAIPADKRSDQQKSELAAYYRSLDAEFARLNQAVAQHANDRANARLLGAQDLAWALINSPAFLFNR